MKTARETPGAIWKGAPLSPALLESQWSTELRHRDGDLDLAAIAFAEADWLALEWNAREALHLNGKGKPWPAPFRALLISQDSVNIHLLRSLQKVLEAWQQWIHLPRVRTMNTLPPPAECRFLLRQAWARLETAEAKYDSLLVRRRLLHQFSLRQWRILQQLAAILHDLGPLVPGADTSGPGDPGTPAHIDWHARELRRLLGQPDYRPDLLRRIRAPRLEINRLLAAACLYQAAFLRTLLQS